MLIVRHGRRISPPQVDAWLSNQDNTRKRAKGGGGNSLPRGSFILLRLPNVLRGERGPGASAYSRGSIASWDPGCERRVAEVGIGEDDASGWGFGGGLRWRSGSGSGSGFGWAGGGSGGGHYRLISFCIGFALCLVCEI
ncbi:hypothetical protein BO86DRAFT_68468 [Aspergillus japonicus CBS 114.51]|uniref:Uncharacterized protein n=1 Tax=Aspergillus japonicus CBS 114.51 TaxID=1448312 RepID=A0A8T8X5Q1_ASPJA|nr:hypothetical protein BO86DRAFT_68468 [Aspergillus japonicus CBS 114.51]RAH82789.1 hypothetical protein BO86DRAFT_68468 [Aspergillus japonicus CBS 114.51]